MSEIINIDKNQIKAPTIQELYDNPLMVLKREQVAAILNQQPPASWVKVHPYVKNYKYLPIDKIEFLLQRIFKQYRIEVLREGTAFNGVYVVVRVWYRDIVSGEMEFHDGIGAMQLQVKSGTSPADLSNINNGALSMAFPIAKTMAEKDACDHLGTIFGTNLNRKDTISFEMDDKLSMYVMTKEEERMSKLIEKANDKITLEKLKSHLTAALNQQYEDKWNTLSETEK